MHVYIVREAFKTLLETAVERCGVSGVEWMDGWMDGWMGTP